MESRNFLGLDPRLVLLLLFASLRAHLAFLLIQVCAAFRLAERLLALSAFLVLVIQIISLLVDTSAAIHT